MKVYVQGLASDPAIAVEVERLDSVAGLATRAAVELGLALGTPASSAWILCSPEDDPALGLAEGALAPPGIIAGFSHGEHFYRHDFARDVLVDGGTYLLVKAGPDLVAGIGS